MRIKNNFTVGRNKKIKEEGLLSTLNEYSSSKSSSSPSIYEKKEETAKYEQIVDLIEIFGEIQQKVGVKIKEQENRITKIKEESKKERKKADEIIEKLKEQIKKQKEDFDVEIKDSIKNSEEGINEKIALLIKDSNKDIDDKIEKTRISVVQSLALFAAFFTFVAVNVQIFTKVTNLESAMLFSLLLLGCLGLFALIIHVILNLKESKNVGILLVVIFSAFIFLGLKYGGDKELYRNEINNFKVNNSSINTLNNDQASTSPNFK